MTQLNVIPFAFESREVRTLLIDDQIWFVASDVAKALQYQTAKDMVRNLDEDERGRQIVPTPSGDQEMLIINESGLYSAILRSRKSEAKRFKKWVTAEVLPAIRKHGHYHDQHDQLNTLIGQTIGTDGFRCLGAVLDGKVKHLAAPLRTRAKQHIWSQVHKAFSVVSAQDIPASSLDAVRNFIGSYALEGEYLPKSQSHLPNDRIVRIATWNRVAHYRYRQLEELSKQLSILASRIDDVKDNLYDPITEPLMGIMDFADSANVKKLIASQDRRRSQ